MAITVEITAAPQINFAMYQNQLAAMSKITVTNDTEHDLEDVTLHISSSPDFLIARDYHLDCILAGNTQTIQLGEGQIENVALNYDFLSQQTERCIGTIDCQVIDSNGQAVASADVNVAVLAYNEWPGIDDPELICAFVTPNASSIKTLDGSVSDILKRWGADSSLEGYQMQKRDRALQLAAAAYSALERLDLNYIVPPASFEQNGQKVRLADEVVQTRSGTCLDLTVTYAALLESIGLNPLIIFTKGHVFAGLWLTDSVFPEPLTYSAASVLNGVTDGEMAVVECTCLTNGQNFEEAEGLALSEIRLEGQFECCADVRRTRTDYQPINTERGNEEEIERERQSRTTSPESLGEEYSVPDGKKLTKNELWERRLLDMTLRNNLIALKPGRKTLPLLVNNIDGLKEQLLNGQDLILQAKPTDWTGAEIFAKTPFETDSYIANAGALLDGELSKHCIRTPLPQGETDTKVLSIYREARRGLDENGSIILYVALGTLKWVDGHGDSWYSPLVLIPVKMIRSPQVGYVLRHEEEDPIFNLTLLQKLHIDYSLDIEGVDPVTDENGEVDLGRIFSLVRKCIKNQKGWSVRNSAALGIFSFDQFVMWRDLHQHFDLIQENKIVSSLLTSRLQWNPTPVTQNTDPYNLCLTLPADSSQICAIRTACGQNSFIIHGPPGTGKSQTITNIISAALNEGMTVLFVAEKKAALEVVEKRLDEVGIGNHCLEMHSNKQSKAAVYDQLKNAINCSSAEVYDDDTDEIIERDCARLDACASEMHQPQPCGISIFDAICRFEMISEDAVFPEAPDISDSLLTLECKKVFTTVGDDLDNLNALRNRINLQEPSLQNVTTCECPRPAAAQAVDDLTTIERTVDAMNDCIERLGHDLGRDMTVTNAAKKVVTLNELSGRIEEIQPLAEQLDDCCRDFLSLDPPFDLKTAKMAPIRQLINQIFSKNLDEAVGCADALDAKRQQLLARNPAIDGNFLDTCLNDPQLLTAFSDRLTGAKKDFDSLISAEEAAKTAVHPDLKEFAAGTSTDGLKECIAAAETLKKTTEDAVSRTSDIQGLPFPQLTSIAAVRRFLDQLSTTPEGPIYAAPWSEMHHCLCDCLDAADEAINEILSLRNGALKDKTSDLDQLKTRSEQLSRAIKQAEAIGYDEELTRLSCLDDAVKKIIERLNYYLTSEHAAAEIWINPDILDTDSLQQRWNEITAKNALARVFAKKSYMKELPLKDLTVMFEDVPTQISKAVSAQQNLSRFGAAIQDSGLSDTLQTVGSETQIMKKHAESIAMLISIAGQYDLSQQEFFGCAHELERLNAYWGALAKYAEAKTEFDEKTDCLVNNWSPSFRPDAETAKKVQQAIDTFSAVISERNCGTAFVSTVTELKAAAQNCQCPLTIPQYDGSEQSAAAIHATLDETKDECQFLIELNGLLSDYRAVQNKVNDCSAQTADLTLPAYELHSTADGALVQTAEDIRQRSQTVAALIDALNDYDRKKTAINRDLQRWFNKTLPCYVPSADALGSLQSILSELSELSVKATKCLSDYADNEKRCHDAKESVKKILGLSISGYSNADCSNVAAMILPCKDMLTDWALRNRCLNDLNNLGLPELFEMAVSQSDIDRLKNTFVKAYYAKIVKTGIQNADHLRGYTSDNIHKSIEELKKADQEHLQQNRARLAKKLETRADQAKIDYVDESVEINRLILHPKTRKSLRTVFTENTDYLMEICPCMLMSPLSVTQFLPISGLKFDLVVFDEASQLPTCKAIGAIARAYDAVIVGDENQLPPTSFFEKKTSNEDDDEDLQDLESLLDDCLSINLPSTYLEWHYRSKHESLIAFSNREFYDDRLLTFPSPDDTDCKVSCTYVSGIYEKNRRINRREAEAVVDEIIRRACDPLRCRQSLGVVAFNQSQQDLIQDLFDERSAILTAEQDPSSREDEPLFIKNLESVQGDERDVILLSIGYGPDKDGNVLQNFGPINRTGGHRRLNVAVSRARMEMMVFTSMRPEQIKITPTSSSGVRCMQAFLAYAKNGGQFTNRDRTACAPGQSGAIPSDIGAEITKMGYQCHYDIGNSAYKVDVAVVDPRDPTRYMAGILIDGKSFMSSGNTRDREFARRDVLAAMGWKLLMIRSIDWFFDRQKFIETLEKELKAAASKPLPKGCRAKPPVKTETTVTAPTSPKQTTTETVTPGSAYPTNTPDVPYYLVSSNGKYLAKGLWKKDGKFYVLIGSTIANVTDSRCNSDNLNYDRRSLKKDMPFNSMDEAAAFVKGIYYGSPNQWTTELPINKS